mmetsp:Transcript_12102/g.18453  ORF Transcript_12102/g.18453 Transcript_12102/m.18453 type:complete len:537 (+) Transcript_12102:84-1694(+)
MSSFHRQSSYGECISLVQNETVVDRDVLFCLTQRMEEESRQSSIYFLLLSAAIVFFMQPGFAMLSAGSVRLKNVHNTMMKHILDVCGAALGFYSFGYAFAFGACSSNKTFLGYSNFFLNGVNDHANWLFQFSFASASATIVAGAVAERCQMAAYLCYSMALTGFIYPVVAHAIWSEQGFLSAFADQPLWDVGMLDFAGSGVVHLTGGCIALIATRILGPRQGRFHYGLGAPLESPSFKGHSIALQVLGTFLLWFGWYGFTIGPAINNFSGSLPGSVSALCAVNTTVSAAAAGVTAMFVNLYLVERKTGEATFDLVYLTNGILTGLVSITAGCAYIQPWAAVVTGIVGGLLYVVTSNFLVFFRIDDAVNAVPVHGVGGMWGLLSTGLLADRSLVETVFGGAKHVGWFYDMNDPTLLGLHCLGILFIVGWTFATTCPFFLLLHYFGWLRADSLEELVGLDISYHGLGLTKQVSEEVEKNDYCQYHEQKSAKSRKKNRNARQVTEGSFLSSGEGHQVPVASLRRDSASSINFHPAEERV